MNYLKHSGAFLVAIRGWRRRANLTQEAAAAEISEHLPDNEDIDPRTYRRWESGNVQPQARHFLALNRILPYLRHLMYLERLEAPTMARRIANMLDNPDQVVVMGTSTPEEVEISKEASEYTQTYGKKIESPGITSYVIGPPEYQAYIESRHSQDWTPLS